MDKILTLIQSPETWFLLIAAPVVTWLFSILKDAVIRGLARSSSSYRQWKSETLAKKEREVDFLSSEPVILNGYNSITATLMMYGLLLLLSTILSVVWIQLMLSSNESFLTLSPYSRSVYTLTGVVLALLTSLMTTVMGFFSGVRIAVGARAYRRLYKRKLAEFEWNEDLV